MINDPVSAVPVKVGVESVITFESLAGDNHFQQHPLSVSPWKCSDREGNNC